MAAVAGITAGVLVAYNPVLFAGILFVLLLAAARSREAAVALWLTVRVLMFSGYIPLPLGGVMLAVITVVALARRVVSGRPLRAPRSAVLWLLLLLLVGLNVAYFGFDPESVYYAREIFVENVLLIALIAATDSKWIRDGAMTAVGLVVIAIGIAAAFEWMTGRPLILNSARLAYAPLAELQTFGDVNRLGSILLNPDLLGAAMAFGFVVWIGLAAEERGFRRLVAMVCAAGLLWVAFLTLSRTVFIGVPVGLGVLLFFAVRRGRVSVGHVVAAIGAVCAVVLAALLLVPDAWLRVTTYPTDPLRLGAYQTALRIIAAHPIEGLGAGWDRYATLAEPYRAMAQYRPLFHPHNSFLELAAMLGLPVALLVALLIANAFAGAVTVRTSPALSAVPFAGMAAIVVMSLIGDPLTIPVLSNLFWALWAVAGRDALEPIRPMPKTA